MADLTSFSIKLFERLDAWISPLEKRLTKLEQGKKDTLADSYQGTFAGGRVYERGHTLTHGGSLWLCMTETNKKPGACADWRLVVKKGSP